MNPWHDVDRKRITKDEFLAMIEIPKGSKNKYELDKDTGRLILDRVLFTSTIYPQNYGFIPLTYARDFDPLDVLVLCSESIVPLAFVKCKPIGVLTMTDNGLDDEKIIAVALNDPFYSQYNDISEVAPHILDEIKHFFTVYKSLEGKETAIHQMKNADEARKIIVSCMEAYNKDILPNLYRKR